MLSVSVGNNWSKRIFSYSLSFILATALPITFTAAVIAQVSAPVATPAASAVDMSTIRIKAPIIEAPPGLPPFPARVDLPVSLSKDVEEPSDDYWNTSANANPDPNGLGSSSQPHAALAQSMLAAHKVVDGFQELRRALELNHWNQGDQPDAALCHRMVGDILMEYAMKAKDTGRGTRGMQRLLNAYIEYRQSVFLNQNDPAARAGLVSVIREIVGVQTTFNNIMALGSANLISGNRQNAISCYAKCLELAQINTASISPERSAIVETELAKLEAQQGGGITNPANGALDQSTGTYVHHVVATAGTNNKTVSVPDESTIKVDSYGTAAFYIENARKKLEREWQLSHIQTSKFPSIAFGVDKYGNLTELRISTSSGNSQIDEDALNVVRRVAPFPSTTTEPGEITYTFDGSKAVVDLSDYMRQMRRKIRHNWHPPHDLQEDHVVASFKVHNDGAIDSIKLSQPSASETRNQACLDAIKNAAPLQHFPEGAPSSVDVQFHFDHAVGTTE